MCRKLVVVAALFATNNAIAQENGAWIFNFLEQNGGCKQQISVFRSSIQEELKHVDHGSAIGKILDRKAKDWSQHDITFAAKIFAACELEISENSEESDLDRTETQEIEARYAQDLAKIVSTSRQDPSKKYGDKFFAPLLCPPSWFGGGSDAPADSAEKCATRLADVEARRELEKADRDREETERLKQRAIQQAETLREAKSEALEAARKRKIAEEELQSLGLQQKFAESARNAAEAETRRKKGEAFTALNPRGSCKANLEVFGQLRLGMSYDQVRGIIGCDGVEEVQTRIFGKKISRYSWSGGIFAYLIAVFEDNRLSVKRHEGLN